MTEINENVLNQLIAATSAMVTRAELAAKLGKSFDGDRDLYEALGYKVSPDFNDFMARYTRQDIAKAVIDKPVNASWRLKPVITESDDAESTPFEKAWNDLVKDRKVFHYLRRVDRLSRIGQYGVLMMGFDDVEDTSDFKLPVEGERRLLYLRPYTQGNAVVESRVIDKSDERYGLPETYKITTKNLGTLSGSGTSNIIVHHTRVLHIAEDLVEDDESAEPALKVILNRLHDLELLSGGSAEMFWRGAFPGMAFMMDKDANPAAQTLADIKDNIEDYVHKLQRSLRLQGIDVKQLAPAVADPSNHIDVQLTLISAATGIPKRILLGSERGELASSQDERNWNMRVDERRSDYVEPMILRPFIDRMIEYGVLPEPADGYDVEWPELSSPTEKEKAEVSKQKTDTLVAYSNSANAQLIIPQDVYLRKIMGFDQEEMAAIEEIQGEIEKQLTTEPGMTPGQGAEE